VAVTASRIKSVSSWGFLGSLTSGGLKASWNFRENLLDDSGNGHTLTWEGGGSPGYTTGLLPGITAAVFDGSHYASVANHDDFNPGAGPFTIEVIKRFSSLTGVQVMAGKMSGDFKGYALIWDGEKIGLQAVEDYSESKYRMAYTPTTGWAIGTLYHIVASWDPADDIRISVNAVSQALIDKVGTISGWNLDNTGAFTVGYGEVETYYFTGDTDLVRFYKGRVLTTEEITANWEVFSTPSPSGGGAYLRRR